MFRFRIQASGNWIVLVYALGFAALFAALLIALVLHETFGWFEGFVHFLETR